MLDIILNPIFLCLTLIVLIIYPFLLFKYTARKEIAKNIEKLWIIFFLLSMMGVTFFPFSKLNPSALSGIDLTPAGAIPQLSIYAYVIFILRTRFRYFFGNMSLLFKNPFLGVLLVIAFCSALWSATPDVTMKASMVLLGTVAYATHISSQYSWHEVAGLWRWSGTCIALASILVALLLPSVGMHTKGWQGVLGHPNSLGALMDLNTVLWFVHAADQPQQRWLSVSLAVVSFTVMTFTHSAGAICIFFVLINMLILLRFLKRFSLPYCFILVIIFIFVGGYLTFFITQQLENILNALGKDFTLTGRTEFWPKIIEAIAKRPFLGYGYKGFWQPWRGTSNPATWITTNSGWVAPHSHNGFLDLTIDLGLFGLFLFIFSFLQNIARGIIYMSRSNLFEATLPLIILVYLVMKNLSETGIWGITPDFFLYVLITVRLGITSKHTLNV